MQDADAIEIAAIGKLLEQMKQTDTGFAEIMDDYNANVTDKASRISVYPLYRWLSVDPDRRVSPRHGVMLLLEQSVARVCAGKSGQIEKPDGNTGKTRAKAKAKPSTKCRQGKKKGR